MPPTTPTTPASPTTPGTSSPSFAEKFAQRVRVTRSIACVGLDPVLDQIPRAVRALHHEPALIFAEFCRGVIDAVADIVPAVKPQSACFERLGWAGVKVLEETCAYARSKGVLVILDAKRGDIGISAEHYAAGAAHAGADAITLSGYLGPSTIAPYLRAGLGVFVLVRTSNPDSDAVQSLPLQDGRSVAEMMADHVRALADQHDADADLSSVGCVVGATKTQDAKALRARMPRQIFLVPGYGAQGGSASDVALLTRPGKDLASSGVVVNASRSVIYAKERDGDWRLGVRDAALAMNQDLRVVGQLS